MQMSFRVARVIALALTLCVACTSAPPSETDGQRLSTLKRQYGRRFDFAFDGDLYLRAVARDNLRPSQDEIREVYRAFMFDESRTRRRPTSFVYLNVYDPKGAFLYQIAFDSSANEFVTSRTEHY